MFDYQLFLAFPNLPSYQKELAQVPEAIRSIFIQSQPSQYLHEILYQHQAYLGKCIGPLVDLAALDFMQTHIYSLLKRLVVHYAYEEHPLVLLAIPVEAHANKA